jgi:DNA integrity scanning protein DisA with diadenylate cyclase activity
MIMENLKRNKTIAMILGIALLIFYIYNRVKPIQLSTIQQIATGQIINILIYLVVRIISAVLCVNIAKRLNRNQTGWGIFGFILPPIALIIIALISVKEISNKEEESQTITQDGQD